MQALAFAEGEPEMPLTRWTVQLATLALLISMSLGGCAPTTGSKAVLTGTWELTEVHDPNSNLTNVLLTFDSDGELSYLSYDYLGVTTTVTGTALIFNTSVDGSDVTLAGTFGGEPHNNLSFDGTLNSDNTVIDGNASFLIYANNTYVYFPSGPATLTKR